MKNILFFISLVIIAGAMVYAAGSQDRGFESLSYSEQIQEIDLRIKGAVDTLAQNLSNPAVTKIGVFTLKGTDMPAGISRFLTERVTRHAIDNQDKKFYIVDDKTNITDAGIITIYGFFSKEKNQVSVTLKMDSSDGMISGIQVVSVPASYLTQVLGIEIEPDNLEIRKELEVVLNDADVTNDENNVSLINIKASFNSDSMTYFHRDELEMTVTADKNCFLKVIHIDSTNQIKMIYPNSFDKNNSLRANIPRKIFETASYMLYEPYGAESIIIIASEKQFPNIESEYIAPWTAATKDSVISIVRGFRGGDLEAGTKPNVTISENEVIYTITILKPHEEYIYIKPENMKDLVDFIRNDAVRQNGTFEGNETSGFYIVNGIRGSYRIPREAPNEIHFTYYFLDNYTGGERAGIRTRGGGFNFSFAKPGNIEQAIHTVKKGIEGKGGTFAGNEQRGTFKVIGIEGQYNVANVVNVNIMEKPFFIQNSMIEKEVKNFFGEK
ncbi:MAG: DUF4384 domain-containing protein [Treponema sp.]|nr:DUF4384 domain-containing protein [Treponema sp.]